MTFFRRPINTQHFDTACKIITGIFQTGKIMQFSIQELLSFVQSVIRTQLLKRSWVRKEMCLIWFFKWKGKGFFIQNRDQKKMNEGSSLFYNFPLMQR